MSRKIDDLIAQLEEGESRLFKAKFPDAVEERFFEILFNFDHRDIISWSNWSSFPKQPFFGTRGLPRRGLNKFSDVEVRFDKKKNRLVDFYKLGLASLFISEKLLKIIEKIDPGSVEVKPIIVNAKDSGVEYYMVMPKRLLHAIDADRCDVDIITEEIGGKWDYSARFPNGVVFDPDISRDIHNFADVDATSQWFWSTELIQAAKNSGIRGIDVGKPGLVSAADIIDSF